MRAFRTLTLYTIRSRQRGSRTVSSRCEMSQQETFEMLEVQTRVYSRFSTRGTQWKFRLNPPIISETSSAPDPVSHFIDSVNNLFDYMLEDVGDADMVGITIHNEVNQSDKPIGFSFRRKDQ